ncbi:MAG: hypothetical protein R2932_34055 [Caldilineaceae bacterium]
MAYNDGVSPTLAAPSLSKGKPIVASPSIALMSGQFFSSQADIGSTLAVASKVLTLKERHIGQRR